MTEEGNSANLELEKISLANNLAEGERSKKDHILRSLRSKADQSSNFMLDFDPSVRRTKKNRASKKISSGVSQSRAAKSTNLFDDKGVHISSGKDLCDCLVSSCAGCHFPCPKCKNTKCGHDCRQNRKWQYEHIDNEVSHRRKNPYPQTDRS